MISKSTIEADENSTKISNMEEFQQSNISQVNDNKNTIFQFYIRFSMENGA